MTRRKVRLLLQVLLLLLLMMMRRMTRRWVLIRRMTSWDSWWICSRLSGDPNEEMTQWVQTLKEAGSVYVNNDKGPHARTGAHIT